MTRDHWSNIRTIRNGSTAMVTSLSRLLNQEGVSNTVELAVQAYMRGQPLQVIFQYFGPPEIEVESDRELLFEDDNVLVQPATISYPVMFSPSMIYSQTRIVSDTLTYRFIGKYTDDWIIARPLVGENKIPTWMRINIAEYEGREILTPYR